MVELLPAEWDDTIAEIHRLQDKAKRASSITAAKEYEREADSLSQDIAHFLRRKYPNNFKVHFVELDEDQFATLQSPLSWTSKSLTRLPRRQLIIDYIQNTHQLEAYDIVIVFSRRGQIKQYSTIFIKPDDVEGSITSNYLIVPRSLSQMVHDLGLTDLAAQELYFGTDPDRWQAWLFIRHNQMEDKEITEEESTKLI